MPPDALRRTPYPADPTDRQQMRLRSVNLVLLANATAVRNALATVLSGLRHSMSGSGISGTVELVLAEVMNNIVEHAYAGQTNGIIQLSIREGRMCLFVEVKDRGLPLPNNALPTPRLPDLIGNQASLPEGGFGWALINSMTENLSYTRQDGQNLLSFSIPRHRQQTKENACASKMPD
jgi:serine/threonine-protein kinase RsbW